MAELLGKPRLGLNTILPRQYQEEDFARIQEGMRIAQQNLLRRIQEADLTDEELANVRRKPRLLYTAATGSGKTTLAAMLARSAVEKGNRVCFLAHRKDLIVQPANRFDMAGIEAGIEMGESYARAMYDPDVVVASVQSMRGDRLRTWEPDYFNFLIIDEAHHAVAQSYVGILNYFRNAFVLGLTATAKRGDKEDLGSVFDHTVTGMNLAEGIISKFLCNFHVDSYDADIDLSDLKMQSGDFSDKDLEERIAPMVEPLANAMKERAGDRQTLNFLPQIKSSQGLASALQSLGIKAEWTSGEDPDRDQKSKDYLRGKVQMMCSANVFLEGVDFPETACIGLMRPTTNLSLLAQMLGRGFRIKTGKHQDLIVVDFNFIMPSMTALAKPIELFDSPGLDEGVLDEAEKILAKDPTMDMLEAFQEGEKEHERKKEIEIRAREARVKWDLATYKPIEFYNTMGVPWRGAFDANPKPPTAKQVDFLTKLGIKEADRISQMRAATTIDYVMNRQTAPHPDGTIGYASFKMVRMMIRQHVPLNVARNMSKAAAETWRKKAFERFARMNRFKKNLEAPVDL